ncbi:hypothetical protein [Streptomyces europaeiscabiei]|uniref:hypothetical protein n=1 Tax=Streptomyces europaeiscabiei TaxID=146819 RepID=UPI002E19F651
MRASEGRLPDYALSYVLVDVAAIVQCAEELGGKVLMPPVTDAAGLTFACSESPPYRPAPPRT